MGISAGPEIPDMRGGTIHVEAGDDCLRIWSHNELSLLVLLDRAAAIALIEDLRLHAHLLGWRELE